MMQLQKMKFCAEGPLWLAGSPGAIFTMREDSDLQSSENAHTQGNTKHTCILDHELNHSSIGDDIRTTESIQDDEDGRKKSNSQLYRPESSYKFVETSELHTQSPKRPSSPTSDDDEMAFSAAHRSVKRLAFIKEEPLEIPAQPKSCGISGTNNIKAVLPISLTPELWKRSGGCFFEGNFTPYPLEIVGKATQLIDALSELLSTMFIRRSRNYKDGSPSKASRLSVFTKKAIPGIGVKDYLTRICTYLPDLEPLILLTVLSYALRLDPVSSPDWQLDIEIPFAKPIDPILYRHLKLSENAEPALCINGYSVHRFLIAAVCLASKTMDDHFYTNDYYAKVGGIPTLELNALELKLAALLDYHLQCTNPRELWAGLSRYKTSP